MRGKGSQTNNQAGPQAFVISPEEKKKAISSSIEFSQINKEVDRILYWIKQEEEKLAKDSDHKSLLFLDFSYSDKLRRAIVDTVLRIFGARILTEEERADRGRPATVGLQATNRPNLFIYYEFERHGSEISLHEKYYLFVSKDMKLPEGSIPDKSDAIVTKTGSSLEKPKIDRRKKEGEERPPGIFKTMNELFLGDEEEKY